MTLVEHLPDCLGAQFDCGDPIPKCHNSIGFDFQTLWNITQQYWGQCPAGPWLFRPSGVVGDLPLDQASLTNDVCELIAGDTSKKYPNSDIWYRLTTWKFPLWQLVAMSPRSPLGFSEEAFSVFHLLGDPIGSTTDLVRKIDSCQSRADYWRHELTDDRRMLKLQEYTREHNLGHNRLWKAFTLIIISYDEWGSDLGTYCQTHLLEELTDLCSETASEHDRKTFLDLCLECANMLAADRSTKFFPVIVAQSLFIGSVILAIIRTKSLAKGPNPQAFIDIETYSIGFTALYFWLISTVTLTSVIGTSQTAEAIPNILKGFRRNLCKEFPERQINLPENLDNAERYRLGGIYSCQPDGTSGEVFRNALAAEQRRRRNMRIPQNSRRRRSSIKIGLHRSWPWFCAVLPFLSVSFGTIIGMVLTSLVPPDGWSCRSIAELAMFVTWLFAWLIGYPLNRISKSHPRIRFWLTFFKDFLAVVATMGIVIATQIGILNRCSCYTNFGRVGLALPQMKMVKDILQYRLDRHYPAITMVGILAQLIIFPVIILGWYNRATRVFWQRDERQENIRVLYGQEHGELVELVEEENREDELIEDNKKEEAATVIHLEEVTVIPPLQFPAT